MASTSTRDMRPANLSQRAGWVTHLFKAAFVRQPKDLVALFKPLLAPDAVVFDIGAHGGHFSQLFSRLAPRGRVYAVEPSAYARSILEPTLRWARCANVQVMPVGLSDAPGRAVLQTPIKRRGDFGFGLAHLGEDVSGRECVAHEVELTTLDALVAGLGLDRLDLIKIDIEGWELNAMRGGRASLERFGPPVYMEVNHDHLARAGAAPVQIWAFMATLGYRARLTPEMTPASEYLGPGDYLWTRTAA